MRSVQLDTKMRDKCFQDTVINVINYSKFINFTDNCNQDFLVKVINLLLILLWVGKIESMVFTHILFHPHNNWVELG